MIVSKVELSLPTYNDPADIQKLNGLYRQLQNTLNELVSINNKETTTILYALKDCVVNGALWSTNVSAKLTKLASLLPDNAPIVVETDAKLKEILYLFKDLLNVGYFATPPATTIDKINQLLP